MRNALAYALMPRHNQMYKYRKYRNIRVVVDNIMFDSKAEAKRYGELKILQTAGKISELGMQPAYPITINGHPVCIVKFDFKYFDNEKKCWVDEDVKGVDNALSKLKRKMVAAQYGIKVVLV
jgi:hypothetical protein